MYTSQLMQKICRKINLKRPAFYNVQKRFCTESAAEEFSRFELEREMKM